MKAMSGISSGRNSRTASAPTAPIFVPPRLTASTPASRLASRIEQPSASAAYARRDPSRCSSMPSPCTWSASSRSASGEYTVPISVVWAIVTAAGWTRCSSPNERAWTSTSAGVSRPSGAGTSSSFEPRKRSGAPHSSMLTCELLAQITAWCGRTIVCRHSTLAAVPLKTNRTSVSSPNSSRISAVARSVCSS